MHAARQPGSLPGLASRLHYERHRPEQTTLYRLVQQHAASFIAHTEASTDAELPRFIKDEFDAFLECGILAHGFLRLRCGECGHDKLLAFSCKRRGFCPSCGARRMSQTAAHLVDHVIPHVPVRQWVLSLPIPLRVLLAAQPELVTPVLQVVQRVVTRHLLRQAGLKADEGHGGAVTLIQRFGSAANLNIHLHCLVLDGVYCCDADGSPAFIEADAPTDDELHALLQTVIARLMKMLTRRGVLVEDMGQTYLAEPDADGEEARTLRPLQAAAITYRIAFGPRAGQKVLTLRGAMPREDWARPSGWSACCASTCCSTGSTWPMRRARISAEKRARSPMKRTRTCRRWSSSTSRSSALRNSFISAPTSSSGRPQFSLEKANRVSAPMPRSRQKSMQTLTARAPARWPITRGRRRRSAHRPLPSMMTARWRGTGGEAAGDMAVLRPPSVPVPWP